jgi:hypothetical protein
MNKIIALMVVVAAAGCHRVRTPGMNPEASAKFRAAWEKRQAGDTAGYRAALQEIANQYPNSRAGQRAQEELKQTPGGSGSMMMGAAAAGVAAAVAVPAFMKYRARTADAAHAQKADLAGPIGIKPAAGKRGWDPLK